MNHYNRTCLTEASRLNCYQPDDKLDNILERSAADRQMVPNLIHKLSQTLKQEEINYCCWKSYSVALNRSVNGDGDLDLLISRADMARFTEILCRLGFKQAQAATEKQLPGVLDYFGYDEATDRLIHIHAHFQLIVGRDLTKNYRLLIERPFLESAIQGSLFKVPSIEFEFILFVIRRVLKHSTWETILCGEGTLKSIKRQELSYLEGRVDKHRVDDILKKHLPYIGVALFKECIQALQPACSVWKRARTGQRLQSKLQVNFQLPTPIDVWLKLWRLAVLAIRRRIFKTSFQYQPAGGGAMIAIVGGDGAGKSTAVDGLRAWLSKDFKTTRIHLGKPRWSWITITIRGILKIGNFVGLYPVDSSFRETLVQKSLVSPGYPWLLREICRARDRYRTYVNARSIAANGGIVFLDRFPLSEIKIMDGSQAERFITQLMAGPEGRRLMSPNLASPLARALIRKEESYYQRTVLPELLVVLRLDPEIAVQRKTDENASSVRERSTEIWEVDWEHTDAHIIDASKSKTDVLTELKRLVWSVI